MLGNVDRNKSLTILADEQSGSLLLTDGLYKASCMLSRLLALLWRIIISEPYPSHAGRYTSSHGVLMRSCKTPSHNRKLDETRTELRYEEDSNMKSIEH